MLREKNKTGNSKHSERAMALASARTIWKLKPEAGSCSDEKTSHHSRRTKINGENPHTDQHHTEEN
jgi:hypothetical protein